MSFIMSFLECSFLGCSYIETFSATSHLRKMFLTSLPFLKSQLRPQSLGTGSTEHATSAVELKLLTRDKNETPIKLKINFKWLLKNSGKSL